MFYADKVRDKVLTDDEATARLKEEFPGMNGDDYVTAMAHGYFLTR